MVTCIPDSSKNAFLITTSSCYPHQADSNLINAYLRNNGWTFSKKIEEAGLIVINTCAFRKQEEDRALEAIRKAQREKKPGAQLIVTGCLPSINKTKLQSIFDGIAIPAGSFEAFPKLSNEKISIKDVKYAGSLVRLRNKEYRSKEYLLRIGWGCRGKCGYCAVRFVFGKPRSRAIPDILQEFNIAYDQGYRRFLLIANDAGSYGEDLDSSLILLISKLGLIKRDCQFALSHLTPNKLKELLPSLKRFVSLGKIWRINLPVQSGSNRIIRLMKRQYSVEDFKDCIEKLLRYNYTLEIKTDIIVGFPQETEEDFLATLKLVEWLGRKRVFFQCLSYSPRPNTQASMLPGQVEERVKRARLKQLLNLCRISYILRDKALFRITTKRKIF